MLQHLILFSKGHSNHIVVQAGHAQCLPGRQIMLPRTNELSKQRPSSITWQASSCDSCPLLSVLIQAPDATASRGHWLCAVGHSCIWAQLLGLEKVEQGTLGDGTQGPAFANGEPPLVCWRSLHVVYSLHTTTSMTTQTSCTVSMQGHCDRMWGHGIRLARNDR